MTSADDQPVEPNDGAEPVELAPPVATTATTAPPPPQSTTEQSTPAQSTSARSPFRLVRALSIAIIVAGGILIAAGGVTWFVVRDQLADEKIVVSDDAERFAGDPVDGPFSAYAEAEVIQKHALEASGGLTYAELPREDPVRQTMMDASFLRASLFTSIVSFGIAAFAAGMGLLMIVIGYILLKLSKVVASMQTTAVVTT